MYPVTHREWMFCSVVNALASIAVLAAGKCDLAFSLLSSSLLSLCLYRYAVKYEDDGQPIHEKGNR